MCVSANQQERLSHLCQCIAQNIQGSKLATIKSFSLVYEYVY